MMGSLELGRALRQRSYLYMACQRMISASSDMTG
jgi:hypothetical protein